MFYTTPPPPSPPPPLFILKTANCSQLPATYSAARGRAKAQSLMAAPGKAGSHLSSPKAPGDSLTHLVASPAPQEHPRPQGDGPQAQMCYKWSQSRTSPALLSGKTNDAILFPKSCSNSQLRFPGQNWQQQCVRANLSLGP